jgi:hypothetical protein
MRSAWLLPLVGAIGVGCGAPEQQVVAPAPIARPPQPERAPADEIQIEGELGTLEPEEIEAPFRDRSTAINRCYEAGLAEAWYLGGPLELKLRITREGAVKSAHVLRPLGSRAVERCVLGVAGGLRFAAPRGGPEAEFSYTLQFRGKAALREWSVRAVCVVYALVRAGLFRCAARR